MVTLTIDGRSVTVPAGTTIMQAADQIGIHIPRLCYHPQLSIEGACRVCVVEVEGQRNLVASCAFPAAEGMVVRTATPEIRQIRRDIVELILDNHPMDCQTCERDGNCELQRLAYAVGVRERLYEGERKSYKPDTSSPSLIRDPEKCILCHRCVRLCREIQHVGVLGYYGRGFNTVVMPAYDAPFQETLCATCGQCINVCPTAAFLEKPHTDRVLNAIADPEKHVVVQVAPSVRAAIGEGFGMPLGVAQTGKMVAALRLLGFDKVFDTQFSADLTVMEEASELVHRIKNGGPLPLITSCSPGWVKFCEHFFPDFLDNLSTCKSPMSMHSAVVKTYYAQKMGLDPKKIYSVAVMCCTAKKFEAERPELGTPEYPYTDAVITTRELIWMIKSAGINFKELKEEDFDHPLGESSGAGTIFGATGGVM
ncbi:MAG: [Fe-Fe] hydrogenase large subunit C-terminal domain-containing protein, partial [Armatimonadota bacterium]